MGFLLRHGRRHPNFLLDAIKVLCGFSHAGLIIFSWAIVENQVHPSISEQEKKGINFSLTKLATCQV